jgi:DNA polymerase-3 subunit gamma/tau
VAESLYRKWRPRSFAELAGQEHVAKTLTNALASGRVSHAYLFAGPRGTGKTSTGRLLGKALNCRNRKNGESCNECESCTDYLSGRAMDLIEMDAASNRGIEEIRSLRDKVAFAPGVGDFKVYLIDEVHMLTDAAFNALLKTLEEPPAHVVFILATTDAHKVPATILSRCQRFDFKRIGLAPAVKTLSFICDSEGIKAEQAALELIARTGTGSLRDSINLLDQMATSYGNDITLEHVRTGLGLIGDERSGRLARVTLAGDLAAGLELIASVRDDGLDLRQFQRELVEELRSILLVKSGLHPDGLSEDRIADLRLAGEKASTAQVLVALRSFGEADLKQDPNSTLPLDIAMAECILGMTATPQPVAVAPPEAPSARTPQPSPPPPPRQAPPPRHTTPPAASVPAPQVRDEPAGANGASTAMPASSPAETAAESAVERAAYSSDGPIELSVGAARRRMRPMFEEAKAASVGLGALLNGACDLIDVSETEMVLGFKYPAHAERAATKANIDLLSVIAERVMGRPLAVRCVLDASIEHWRLRENSNRSALVRAAQEMGARVMSSEPPEENA